MMNISFCLVSLLVISYLFRTVGLMSSAESFSIDYRLLPFDCLAYGSVGRPE